MGAEERRHALRREEDVQIHKCLQENLLGRLEVEAGMARGFIDGHTGQNGAHEKIEDAFRGLFAWKNRIMGAMAMLGILFALFTGVAGLLLQMQQKRNEMLERRVEMSMSGSAWRAQEGDRDAKAH
jgi:hypothetical protein